MKIRIKDLLDFKKHLKSNDLLSEDIKVLTPSGYKRIFDVDVTANDEELFNIINDDNDILLSCSGKHLLKDTRGNWIKVSELENNPTKILTQYGSAVLSSTKTDDKIDMLDIHVDGNEYYTNGILSHNSSLISALDYAIYGKVKGNRGKAWATLSTLPNRINNELLVGVKFKSGGTDIDVTRGMNPNVLTLLENGVEDTRAGKSNINDKIVKYAGIDLDTFKSFISMSVNDFKNFMSLSSDEKKMLLDKLFNLEVINTLNDILKELNKANRLSLAKLDTEISTLNDSIESIKDSIKKAVEKEKLNIQSEIDEIKTKMESKKEEYKTLKEKIDKISVKEVELSEAIDAEKKRYLETVNEIKNIQKEIDLYDLGKCPTCSSDFNTDHFLSLKDTLNEKLKSVNSIKVTIDENMVKLKERNTKLKEISTSTNSAFSDLKYLLSNYKSQIEKLEKKKESDDSNKDSIINLEEFNKSISDLESKKDIASESTTISKEKEQYYKELNRIFSEDGVKKKIISGIVKPINNFIKINLKKMSMPFDVELDETFSAKVRVLGSEIDHDTLSSGEHKKINFCILIAYLKLIRSKKFINVLFLDEALTTVDIEGVTDILHLLKSFADEYKINIFVVHHAMLNAELFDRILKINKDVFTTIEEVRYDDSDISLMSDINEEEI